MKHFFKKRKALMFSVLILIVFFTSFSVVIGAGFSWFGGNMTAVPCTCTPGSYLVILLNTGHNAMFNGTYLYSPATIKMGGKGIPGGTQILGLYSPGGTCMMGVEPYCYSTPITKGTMTIIGTN